MFCWKRRWRRDKSIRVSNKCRIGAFPLPPTRDLPSPNSSWFKVQAPDTFGFVGVANDERMQIRYECRSSGECRRGDAETKNRAEADAEKKQMQSRKKCSAERKAEVQKRRTETRRKGAEQQRPKPAEFRAKRREKTH